MDKPGFDQRFGKLPIFLSGHDEFRHNKIIGFEALGVCPTSVRPLKINESLLPSFRQNGRTGRYALSVIAVAFVKMGAFSYGAVNCIELFLVNIIEERQIGFNRSYRFDGKIRFRKRAKNCLATDQCPVS